MPASPHPTPNPQIRYNLPDINQINNALANGSVNVERDQPTAARTYAEVVSTTTQQGLSNIFSWFQWCSSHGSSTISYFFPQLMVNYNCSDIMFYVQLINQLPVFQNLRIEAIAKWTWQEHFMDHKTSLELLSRDSLSSPPFALVTYMKTFYNIRSEIQGKLTGPWNIGQSDLLIIWGHWECQTEQVPKVWGFHIWFDSDLIRYFRDRRQTHLTKKYRSQWPINIRRSLAVWNWPKQMFQMALLLIKKNTCAK